MGHNWRDVDPIGAEKHDQYIERRRGLRQKLKDVSLDKFTAGELGAVMRLFGLAGISREPHEEHFRILEKRVKKMAKAKKKKARRGRK
jgi:hypothetical protein